MWFSGLRLASFTKKAVKAAAEAEPAEWYVEMKANQDRAYAFRGKVLIALDEQGLSPEIRQHIEPELMLAALLLGVKE